MDLTPQLKVHISTKYTQESTNELTLRVFFSSAISFSNALSLAFSLLSDDATGFWLEKLLSLETIKGNLIFERLFKILFFIFFTPLGPESHAVPPSEETVIVWPVITFSKRVLFSSTTLPVSSEIFILSEYLSKHVIPQNSTMISFVLEIGFEIFALEKVFLTASIIVFSMISSSSIWKSAINYRWQ